MCLKIDNKSDWCSRESLAKNISTSCVGFMLCQVLDCNTLPSLRHGIRNYYLLALLSWWWIIEAPRKNISLSFVFFTIGSYRSLLNCLFCSLALWLTKGNLYPSGLRRHSKLKSIGKCNWNMLWTLITMLNFWLLFVKENVNFSTISIYLILLKYVVKFKLFTLPHCPTHFVKEIYVSDFLPLPRWASLERD